MTASDCGRKRTRGIFAGISTEHCVHDKRVTERNQKISERKVERKKCDEREYKHRKIRRDETCYEIRTKITPQTATTEGKKVVRIN